MENKTMENKSTEVSIKYYEKMKALNTGYNDELLKTLVNTKKYQICRLGQVEFNVCHGEHLKLFPSKELITTRNSLDQYCRKNAGFYYKKPSTENEKNLSERAIFYIFQNKYLNAMFECDHLLVYQMHLDGYTRLYKSVLDRLSAQLYYEPLNLYLLLLEYYTTVLNKKVLFVSNFVDSMKKQLPNMKLLFPDYNIKTENFIFYKSYQTISGNSPHDNWYETYKVMKNDILKLEFDYAFLGCGCYGLPLCNDINKEKESSSVFYIGATVQLLFGIGGRRWKNNLHNPNYWFTKYYNKYWIECLESEKPVNYKQVESGCYW